jgi:hypothetical protein
MPWLSLLNLWLFTAQKAWPRIIIVRNVCGLIIVVVVFAFFGEFF